MSDKRRDWPIITISLAVIAVVFVVGLWINSQRVDDVRHLTIAICEAENEARAIDNETADAIADMLEGLRFLVDEDDTEVAGTVDEAIRRLRREDPLTDCENPLPSGRP